MKYEIDLMNVTTKSQFQELIQKSIPCPDYYGRNLDALYDVLTEYCEAVEIVFLHFQEFLHQLPGYAEAVQNMCMDAQADNPQLKIIFREES